MELSTLKKNCEREKKYLSFFRRGHAGIAACRSNGAKKNNFSRNVKKKGKMRYGKGQKLWRLTGTEKERESSSD